MSQTTEQARQATILIVDDDVRNSRLLEAQLHAEGHRTLYATSGEAALELMKTELPDLILLDVMMPGMSGFELAVRLKLDAVLPARRRRRGGAAPAPWRDPASAGGRPARSDTRASSAWASAAISWRRS
ncbi:MAG: response regulator [Gallionella sp.]|nr:response regulator [Gallionella sp.]